MNNSAKEMFEELGYKYIKKHNRIEVLFETLGEKEDGMPDFKNTVWYYRVQFDLEKKVFWSEDNLDIKTFKAIQQQIKELGWDKEDR